MRIVTILRHATARWRAGRREDSACGRDIGYEEFRALPATALRAKLAGDTGEAARWIRAGAHHGFPEAQLMLGQMLLDGSGVDRDHAAAMRWFNRAADAGLAEAMNMVGRCQEMGWGVPANPATAAAWYRRAAERGLAWGQFNLANLLLYGNGVPRDRRVALDWYRRAAAQGHAKSMNLIGRFLEEGWEGSPDPAQALTWYRAAAEKGDFRGQYNLATLLVSQGYTDEPARWFREAIDGGSPDFLLCAGKSLSGRREPDLRRLGEIALARFASMTEQAAA